jgi:hypothetical protein
LILCGEQELVDPIVAILRENYASVDVLVQALLEYPSIKIVCLAPSHFLDSFTEFVISDSGLARRFGEPGGFESPRGYHIPHVALAATDTNYERN